MTDRASIIEKVAAAMEVAGEKWIEETRAEAEAGHYRLTWADVPLECLAAAALDAIAPPGEAWVAPHEPTQAMIEASREFTYDPAWPEEPVNIYRAMRDQYLSDKGKG